jgi:hypothetical protein
MRKFLLLCFAILCVNLSAKATAGDTTWVQANNVQLGNYDSNYDTSIVFPASGTYRKIYMIVTLGKYMCPGYPSSSVPYCGDWDYTIQNYLMTPGGDTLEIGRLITPYANNGAPRTPWTWTQPYVYDVTDYASLLQGSNTVRLFFSGWSPGFTANTKFMFISGTPDRNVVGIKKLWNGSYAYGDTVGGDVNDINTHFTALAETAPAGTVSADLKFTVTGHGSDTINQCCEFASHNFQVMLNSSAIATQTVWRGDCGLNELYPQSGTWPLTRANWCPGALVYSYFYQLPSVSAGSNFNLGVKFDTYDEMPATTVGYGSYTTFGTLIYYGAINKTLDASIEEIIAPTNDPNHFRENPIAGQPVIHVHNSGSTAISSIDFQYGVVGSTMQTYSWTGTLASLADTEISLAAVPQLDSIAGHTGTYNFIAEITAVNGVADNDHTNDTLRSQFLAAPKWPSSFRIQMYTSDIPAGTSTTVAETSWAVYDLNKTVVAQRTNCGFNTLYNDTLNLPTGYYQFVVYDSFYYGDCFGLQSFLFEYPNSGYVPGYLYVEQLNSYATTIPMNGYPYGKTTYVPATGSAAGYYTTSGSTYNNDFGQGYSQYFYVVNANEAVKNVNAVPIAMNVFPNPARSTVNIDITGLQQVSGTIEILDVLGRVVSRTICNNPTQQIDVTGLASGAYTVIFYNNNDVQNKLQTKLIIAK